MEELLENYSARYGSRGSIVAASDPYDNVTFLPVESGSPGRRRLSSSRRRAKPTGPGELANK